MAWLQHRRKELSPQDFYCSLKKLILNHFRITNSEEVNCKNSIFFYFLPVLSED